MSGSKMLVSDEEKRWVVVGIVMNKVVAPVLRDTIKQGMDSHYNNLDTHCNGLPVPCILKTLTYHQASTDGTLKNLKFGNVNNNSQLYGNIKSTYDYSVSSSVDLAKLYLPDYLAKFAAFNESMDISAILRLLGFCRPAPIFPSPNPALSIQAAADDVKDSVRNKWGHCDISEWTEAFFNDCFTKLEALVRSVGLTGGVEKIIIDQLCDWRTKGCQLCMGHAVDQSLLSLVQQEVLSLCNQAKQVKENKETLERLVYIAKSVREEMMNRIQQLERGFAQFDKTVQQLKEDMDTREKTPAASPLEPFDVETCRSKLADHYARTARVPTTVWSSIHHVDIHQIYTRLSWVREEHTTTGSSLTKLEDYTDVFRQTENGILPKRILVQGQAGIGKSTFVKKLAVDWVELHRGGSTGERKEAVDCAELDQEETSSNERKEALGKFELVLVVKLRDISPHCQSLTELISSSGILPKDHSTLTNGLLDFVAKSQEKVLLVLDGYDEYSGESESVIPEIFQGDVLRDCCVLVTSRPSKADELRGFADVHAEITGFSKEDIQAFMCRMLGSKYEASNLESCLCTRKLLDLACVPLLLLFYCTLWKKGKWKSFPENRTELYTSIVQCLLDYSHGKCAAGCYSKVEDNKEILAEMGKVALEALLKDDLVFDYDKLSEAVRCEGSRIIGLLQVTEYAENERPAGKVSFIHKSIQEFLAAWYITHICIPEGNLGPVDEAGNTFEKCLFLENVLWFVCGLSVDGAKKVFRLLESVRICDPTVDVSKTVVLLEKHGSDDSFKREEEFQVLIFKCFREAHSKEELLRPCLDCTGGIVLLPTTFSGRSIGKVRKDLSRVKDYGDFILTHLFHPSNLCIPGYLKVALSMDKRSEILKLADFFAKFQDGRCKTCKFGSFLWLKDSEIQFYITQLSVECDEHAVMLSEAFVGPFLSNSADSGSSTERSTTLSRRTLGGEAAQCCSFPSLTNKLETFSGPPVQPESCFKFLRRVRCEGVGNVPGSLGTIVNKSQHLSSFEVVCTDDSICDLLRQLPNPSTCSLELDSISLTLAGAVQLASLLPRFNNISTTSRGLGYLRCESVMTLAGKITNKTLKSLSLDIDLIPEAAVTLGRSLSEMSELEELCLLGKGNCLCRREKESLFGGFEETIYVRTHEVYLFGGEDFNLLFSESEINEDGATVLAEGFGHFPNLKRLTLMGHGVRSVMPHITNLPKLRKLALSNTGCSKEDVTYFHDSFRHLPKLEELNLSGNPMGHGVKSVMSHITNLPKLSTLNLSNTGCSKEDVEYFHEFVRHLPNLEELNLSRNPLGHGVRSVMSHITNLPKLRMLDLSNTSCTKEDVEYFHDCVRHLPNLMELNLSRNPLGHGVKSVMSHITNLPKLNILNLSSTGCSEEDVEYFHDCVRHLPNLEELNLSRNPLGHGVRSVMSHITNLPKLRKLALSNTGCTKEDVEYFHEGINSLMKVWCPQLDLSSNPLGQGVRSIVSNITNFPEKGELNLCNTGCSEEDMKFVQDVVAREQNFIIFI